jgi:hypothetical protein
MNERIKELANRAMVVREDGWSEFDVNVFAELIVRQCVKEIELQYGGGSDQPMDSEWDRAIECVSSMVKYRFGVQE